MMQYAYNLSIVIMNVHLAYIVACICMCRCACERACVRDVMSTCVQFFLYIRHMVIYFNLIHFIALAQAAGYRAQLAVQLVRAKMCFRFFFA